MATARTLRASALAALLPALLAGSLALACGDDGATGEGVTAETDAGGGGQDAGGLDDAGGAGPDVGGQDAGIEIDAGGPADAGEPTDATEPADAGQDGGGPDVPAAECPGGAGCPCDGNMDCDLGLCITTASGKRCAAKCVDACEPGFQCVPVAASGGDTVTICVPLYDWLCDPCTESKACQKVGLEGAACVDYGAKGAFCGIPCNDDGVCAEGTECKLVGTIEGGKSKQCVREPDAGEAVPGTCACTKAAALAKLSTVCYIEATNDKGQVVGKCPGTRKCTADGLSPCDAPPQTAESCDGIDNDCDGETDESTCDDSNPCTKDACEAKAGKCTNGPLADGIACDDGSACTKADTCKGGSCDGVALSCDDGNPCTTNTCDPKTGCKASDAQGAGCDDDNPCTVGDICKDGGCAPGKAKVCKSTEDCLAAKCDPISGKCKFLELDAPCDDGNLCTKADTCKQGFCAGKAIDCDDKNPCTSDTCQKDKGCASVPNTSPCDDGDACTEADGCAGGKCVGLALDVSQDCDDGNPCTTDTCDPNKGCAHAAASAGCDDGNPCTVGDICKDGGCSAGTNTCDCAQDVDCTPKEDGDLCNGTLFCDKSQAPWKCKVNPKTVVTCGGGSGGPCAKTACAPETGKCAAELAPDGKACDADGSLCTQGDACKGGKCAPGAPAKCDDKNPCTTDTCDPKKGCVHTPNTAPCDADDNACTLADHCADKVCVAGKKKLCDDANACTADTCKPATGKCAFDAGAVEAAPCDADGSVCTVKDTCKSGACVSGKPLPCDDANPCTTDACDPKKGCTHAPNELACNDGDPCTAGDACKAGKCLPGKNVCGCLSNLDCAPKEDGDLCNGTLFCNTAKLPYQCEVKASTVVKCDPSGDTACAKTECAPKTGKCAAVSQPDGSSCSDGDACTAGDACKGGKCAPGAAKQCDDKNPCTIDKCDKTKGCVHTVDTATPFECYAGDPATKGIGLCKAGTKHCKADGGFGPCVGQVLPASKELCNGHDDTCDGKTDTGCAPVGMRVGFGGVRLDVQGGAHGMRAHAMGDGVAGPAGGTGKLTVTFGFDRWLRQVLGL